MDKPTGDDELEVLIKNTQQAETLNVQNRSIFEFDHNIKSIIKDKYPKFKKLLKQTYTDIKIIGECLHNLDKDFGPYETSLREQNEFYNRIECELRQSRPSKISNDDSHCNRLEERLKHINYEIACLEDVLKAHKDKLGTFEKLQNEMETLQKELKVTDSQEMTSTGEKLISTEKACSEARNEINILIDKYCTMEKETHIIENENTKYTTQIEMLKLNKHSLSTESGDINANYQKMEHLINELDNKLNATEQYFATKHKSKDDLLAQIKNSVELNARNIMQIQKDVDDLTQKTNDLDTEIHSCEKEIVDIENDCKNEANLILTFENAFSDSNTNIEKLSEDIQQFENYANDQNSTFNELKAVHDTEMLTIEERTSVLKAQYEGTIENIEKDKHNIDTENKSLENLLKECNNKLDEENNSFKENTTNHKHNEAKLEIITTECDNIQAKIQSTQTYLDQALSKFTAPTKPLSLAFHAKKRVRLDDSDSSADGEKLTFSQYMQRKKKRQSK